jgi:hypothetical protein
MNSLAKIPFLFNLPMVSYECDFSGIVEGGELGGFKEGDEVYGIMYISSPFRLSIVLTSLLFCVVLRNGNFGDRGHSISDIRPNSNVSFGPLVPVTVLWQNTQSAVLL